MRVFTIYKGTRYVFDVAIGQTVGEMKNLLRRKFDLDAVPSDEGGQGVLMSLTYAGASLNDDWVFSDISIPPGATLRCELQEHIKSYLEVFCVYSGDTKRFTEPFDVWETKVADLKTMITDVTGLHVSVFRLVTLDGKEMFDCHLLKNYGVTVGDTVRLETWNGWGPFLLAATAGQLTPTLKHMVNFNEDPLVAKYQLRVALFVAAHFGYHQLAAQLLKSGARSDEPVGEHPVREWCNDNVHPDYFKTPVHEAAQHGSLHCLRQFLHHNYACILARESSGLTPCNLARRYRQTECFKLLIAEQFRSRSMSGLTLGMYARIRKWQERAKDRAAIFHKHSPNPILLAMEKRSCRNAVVGQKVQISGFGENQQTGAAKMNPLPALAAKSVKFKMLTTGGVTHGNKALKSTPRENSEEQTSEPEVTSESGPGVNVNAIESVFITEESVKSCNSRASEETTKPEGVNYVLPAVRADSRFHREGERMENWNTNKMQIKGTTKKAPKAARSAYRWKDLPPTDMGKPSKTRQILDSGVDQRESMPQILDHNCLVCTDLQQAIVNTNNVSKDAPSGMNTEGTNEAVFVTETKVLIGSGEKSRVNGGETASVGLVKIPPLRKTSPSSLRTDSRPFKDDGSRKSDEDTKHSRARGQTQSAGGSSIRSNHKRATSEDLSLQSSSLYRMITGRDTKEWARSSLDVAMTFNKKRWLQQVQMAVDFNRNTFKRELLKFGSEQGQHSWNEVFFIALWEWLFGWFTRTMQTQEKGTRSCACVVLVHTWLMLVLVLASSWSTRGLCLCLRRTKTSLSVYLARCKSFWISHQVCWDMPCHVREMLVHQDI